MINNCILGGRLGADPETKNTETGSRMSTFRLCTTERGFITRDGRQIPDRDTWHNVGLFGALADYAKNLHKGDFAVFRGKYHNYNYTVPGSDQTQTWYTFDVDEILYTSNIRKSDGANVH